MFEVGDIDENGMYYQYIVKNRVTIGFGSALLFFFMACPTRISVLIGLPFAIFGEIIRTYSSGVVIKTKELTSDGPYAVVRNPLYLGSFIMALGVAAMAGSPLLVLLVAVLFPAIYIGVIVREEKVLLDIYGDDFREYCAKVPRLVPSPGALVPTESEFNPQRMIFKHKEWRAWVGLFAMVAYLFMIAA